LENFPLDEWNRQISVGLTGAFLCSKVFGTEMAVRGNGVIVNVASDLSIIAPDQRLYRVEGVAEDEQPAKPVTYSVIKTGLIGLTRYLAGYWAASGVRVNAISPGGVYNGHSDEFVARLSSLIPMGRMANVDEYRAAKARIYADQTEGDVAIVNADDPVVLAAAPSGHGSPQVVAFAGAAPGADGFTERDGVLVAPDGLAILDVADLPRSLPHDRTNALAAAAAALAAGATLEGVRVALRSTVALPHRVQLIGERDGVRWIDDSKATAPHATLAALQGFESVVLVAGGRNKGLDLAALAEAGPRVRAVVGIGEAADEVVAAFPDRPSSTADTMSDAVLAARSLAEPGDVVLLSPGCASFDWYSSYAERGDDFTAQVRDLVLQDAS
jgi:hypothetical protein